MSTHKRDLLARVNLAEANYLAPKTLRGKLRLIWGNLTKKTWTQKVPTFEEMEIGHVKALTCLDPMSDLEPPVYWTPLIQLVDPSEELLEKIEYIHHEHEKNNSTHYKTTEKAIEYYKTESRNIISLVIFLDSVL